GDVISNVGAARARVATIVTGDDADDVRGIARARGNRPRGVERRTGPHEAVAAHTSTGRLESDDAPERGGAGNQTPRVGAGRDGGRATGPRGGGRGGAGAGRGGARRCGAAARAAGRAFEVPRVSRRPERRLERRAEAELHHVELADEDRARGAQPRNGRRVL